MSLSLPRVLRLEKDSKLGATDALHSCSVYSLHCSWSPAQCLIKPLSNTKWEAEFQPWLCFLVPMGHTYILTCEIRKMVFPSTPKLVLASVEIKHGQAFFLLFQRKEWFLKVGIWSHADVKEVSILYYHREKERDQRLRIQNKVFILQNFNAEVKEGNVQLLEVKDHHTWGLNASKLWAFFHSCIHRKTSQSVLVARNGRIT